MLATYQLPLVGLVKGHSQTFSFARVLYRSKVRLHSHPQVAPWRIQTSEMANPQPPQTKYCGGR